MFKYLKKFRKIIVTGPNRSGTRICARMISQDLGYPYIDEEDIHMDSLYTFSHYLFDNTPYVIQCPALSRYIHNFNSDRWAVVFMKRNAKEIISSQNRINWSWEWLERLRYDRTEGDISEIKYNYLKSIQKKKMKNLFIIDFMTLSQHPMWIDRIKRKTLLSPTQYALNSNSVEDISKMYPFPSPGISIFFLSDRQRAVLFNSKRKVLEINSLGIEIWKLCNGNLKSEDIVKRIKFDFNNLNKSDIKTDIFAFLNKLIKAGFIQIFKSKLS